jgi:hypothetical protein
MTKMKALAGSVVWCLLSRQCLECGSSGEERCCVLTWQKGTKGEELPSPSSHFIKTPNCIHEDRALMTQSPPNTVALGIKLQCKIWRQQKIFNP